MNNPIIVTATINAPLEQVWKLWTEPTHITQWNAASSDWHTPRAENDLKPGGHFNYHMAAKDGSFAFDFGGAYDDVLPNQRIAYTIGDGRKVEVNFGIEEAGTTIIETFEPEEMNPREMQQSGWQAILDNFKQYAEAQS